MCCGRAASSSLQTLKILSGNLFRPFRARNSFLRLIQGRRAAHLPLAILFHAFSVKIEPSLTVGLLPQLRNAPRTPDRALTNQTASLPKRKRRGCVSLLDRDAARRAYR